MSITRLKAGQICGTCSSATDVPHGGVYDCLAAVEADLVWQLGRVLALSAQRRELLRQQIERCHQQLASVRASSKERNQGSPPGVHKTTDSSLTSV
jgi:hypothetical protein